MTANTVLKGMELHIKEVTGLSFTAVPEDGKVRSFIEQGPGDYKMSWQCVKTKEFGVFWCADLGRAYFSCGPYRTEFRSDHLPPSAAASMAAALLAIANTSGTKQENGVAMASRLLEIFSPKPARADSSGVAAIGAMSSREQPDDPTE